MDPDHSEDSGGLDAMEPVHVITAVAAQRFLPNCKQFSVDQDHALQLGPSVESTTKFPAIYAAANYRKHSDEASRTDEKDTPRNRHRLRWRGRIFFLGWKHFFSDAVILTGMISGPACGSESSL